MEPLWGDIRICRAEGHEEEQRLLFQPGSLTAGNKETKAMSRFWLNCIWVNFLGEVEGRRWMERNPVCGLEHKEERSF